MKLFLAIFYTIFFNLAAYALELEITEGAATQLNVAFAPFATTSAFTKSQIFQQTITKDLRKSQRFSIIETKSLDPKQLKNLSAEALITGSFTEIDTNRYKVTFKIQDQYRTLFNSSFTVFETQLPKLAHHLSNQIYWKFLGIKGLFTTKIAYILVQNHKSSRRKIYKLMLADYNGQNAQALFTSYFPLMSPTWSPDGKKIAYVSFENHRAAIYLQKIATGERELLAKFPGINGAPAFSPDGKMLAIVLTTSGSPKIHLLDLASRKLKQVTTGSSLDTEPSWSPDGKFLLFTSNRYGSPQICQLELATQKISRLTYTGKYNVRATFVPNFHPHDQAVVMLHKEGDLFTIALQNLTTGQILLLSPTGHNEPPSVAPNGKMVIYAVNSGTKSHLAVTSIDGKVRYSMREESGQVEAPAWSPWLD